MLNIFKKIFSVSSQGEQLEKVISRESFLVDVRTSGEFSLGSVKGAVNIPLGNLRNELFKFKDQKNIVVFCKSGARSAQAKRILEQNGIQNVTNGRTWKNVQAILSKQ
ncbi:rhodanese-like domain-containing protein [Myroides indicus]|uniref:Rhodanese-related sulfurtransferase n=1 Tax=Myroides indicus TaxID=1323422 RepID=A0A4R7FAF0_9FLAO|nr:rhodanese-like domain-containing protein [Myroides indicus]TDS66198.1 rhodanese-related sulfurtransferase [Myroides indicus]